MLTLPPVNVPNGLVANGPSPTASSPAAAAPATTSPQQSVDVEMVDVSTSAVAAAANTIEWSITDQLLLVSVIQQVYEGLAPAAHAHIAPLAAQFDWNPIAHTIQSKSTSQAALGAFQGEACCTRFSQLLIESGVNSKFAAPLPPLALQDIQPAFSVIIQKLVKQRIAQLESEGTLATTKQSRLEATIQEATTRLQQQREAAAAASASQASPAPVPIASSTTGAVNVKLESIPISRQPSTVTSESANRPSPLQINSPSVAGGLGLGSTQIWPNSSLHTPLKQVSLSRQHSTPTAAAAAGGLQSPTPLGRQATLLFETPGTPMAQAPVALSSAKLLELFNIILNTLTSRPEADVFLQPVNPDEAVGYYDVIKTPMSFQDVTDKIKEGEITHPSQFWSAVQQIYTNCYAYNDKKTPYYKQAKVLEGITLDMFRKNFPTYSGPWEAKKGASGRPPKYTVPPTPTLTNSNSYTAPSPMPTPTAAATPAQFTPIPINLPTTSSVAAATNAPLTPSTPTRKLGAPRVGHSGASDTAMDESTSAATTSAATPAPTASSNELPRGAPTTGNRRASTSTSKKGGRTTDADGDESMGAVSEEPTTETANETESTPASVTPAADEIGSIHDALSTPARATNSRKRGASALTSTPATTATTTPAPVPTPTPTTTSASAASTAAATPATARKGAVRRTAGAPPTPTVAPTPSPNTTIPASPAPQAEETSMEVDSSAADKSKRRGRPPKK